MYFMYNIYQVRDIFIYWNCINNYVHVLEHLIEKCEFLIRIYYCYCKLPNKYTYHVVSQKI